MVSCHDLSDASDKFSSVDNLRNISKNFRYRCVGHFILKKNKTCSLPWNDESSMGLGVDHNLDCGCVRAIFWIKYYPQVLYYCVWIPSA